MTTFRLTSLRLGKRLISPIGSVIFLTLLFLTACTPQKQIVFTETPPTIQSSEKELIATALHEAETAWNEGNMQLAEQHYGRLAVMPQLSAEQRTLVFKHYAMSAAANKHPYKALDALERWLTAQPKADATTAWQETWLQAISELPPMETAHTAQQVYSNTNRPWTLRSQAGLLFAKEQWQSNAPAAMQLLAEIGSQSQPSWRAHLEKSLYTELQTVSPATFDRIYHTVTQQNTTTYPYTIVQLEYARRLMDSPYGVRQATELLSSLQQYAIFDDPQLLTSVLGGGASSSECTALALPISGSFAPIGLKVMRGANAAQWELSNNGIDMKVHVINTESADWIQQIEALPAQCVVIGGPLRTSKFTAAYNAGLSSRRAFFTFTPKLDNEKEGAVAWRFFNSPDDQLTTLLRFTESLGITQYGTLYPDEPYGHQMATDFATMVQQQGNTIVRASYNPKAPSTWNHTTRNYLKTKHIGKFPMPTSSIEATFLPDGWSAMEMLVPNIFYNGEDRHVLLGSSLWAQGLSSGEYNSTNNFGLAVFPGVWNPEPTTQAGKNLVDSQRQAGLEKPDSWVGIGYDFVRFASKLHVSPQWTAEDINRKLASAKSISWSIAPIDWTPEGIATQHMFLFTPTTLGFTLVNPIAFKKRLEYTRARHEQRIRAAKKEAAK